MPLVWRSSHARRGQVLHLQYRPIVDRRFDAIQELRLIAPPAEDVENALELEEIVGAHAVCEPG